MVMFPSKRIKEKKRDGQREKERERERERERENIHVVDHMRDLSTCNLIYANILRNLIHNSKL